MTRARSRVRLEWSWALAAIVAMALGATGAEAYARVTVPYYALVAGLIASGHNWTIDEIVVTNDPRSQSAILRMTGEVFEHRDDLKPAARVVSRVQVGEAVEILMVYWTVLLLLPAATIRQRAASLLVGTPVFLGLVAVTTVCQLVHPMAEASALLAGDPNPLTAWERWSRFLEAGGGFVIALVAAILTSAVSRPLAPKGDSERSSALNIIPS